MKVLFVVFEFQTSVSGGVGRVINGLAPELARSAPVHVLWVFGSRWHRRRFQLYELCPDGTPRKRGGPLLQTPENVVRTVRQEGYDVVHCFCVHPVFTEMLAALKARLPQVRLVFSVHNLLAHEQAVRTTTSALLQEERRTLELCDHLHVLNQAGLRYLSASYPQLVARKPPTIISNGLAEQSFVARDEALSKALAARTRGHAAVISCLSRWAPGKGLEVLASAVQELLAESDVCLVLAGRKRASWEVGSKQYVRHIDRCLRRLGRRAVVLGWLDEAQRNSLLDATDVCVMPSELEYFSYASFEALHQGVPLVQSRLDCLVEVLRDGAHCVFFAPGDAGDLREKLGAVVADGQRARAMAARGRARVRELLRWGPIAEEYLAMYQGLFAPTSRPTRALCHESAAHLL